MYLDLRAITRCETTRLGDDRQAHHRLLQHLAFSETCHNRDIFPTNTMAYDMTIAPFCGNWVRRVDGGVIAVGPVAREVHPWGRGDVYHSRQWVVHAAGCHDGTDDGCALPERLHLVYGMGEALDRVSMEHCYLEATWPFCWAHRFIIIFDLILGKTSFLLHFWIVRSCLNGSAILNFP